MQTTVHSVTVGQKIQAFQARKHLEFPELARSFQDAYYIVTHETPHNKNVFKQTFFSKSMPLTPASWELLS